MDDKAKGLEIAVQSAELLKDILKMVDGRHLGTVSIALIGTLMILTEEMKSKEIKIDFIDKSILALEGLKKKINAAATTAN